MIAERHPNPNQPHRSAEGRRLVPYFLAALLIHLTLIVYAVRNESDWHPAPLAAMSLTLDHHVAAPPPALPPAHAAPHPAPPAKAHAKAARIIATPAPAIQPQPANPPPESPPKAVPPLPLATPAATANTASSPPSTEAAGNPPPATSPPRFDAAYLLNPKPDYPPISRRLGEEGRVLLRVRVNPQGLPAAIELEKSSGSERLDDAARRVVARWRFVPARRGEQPVEAWVLVPIAFRLEG